MPRHVAARQDIETEGRGGAMPIERLTAGSVQRVKLSELGMPTKFEICGRIAHAVCG